MSMKLDSGSYGKDSLGRLHALGITCFGIRVRSLSGFVGFGGFEVRGLNPKAPTSIATVWLHVSPRAEIKRNNSSLVLLSESVVLRGHILRSRLRSPKLWSFRFEVA